MPNLHAFTPPQQHVIPFLIGRGFYVCSPDSRDMRPCRVFDVRGPISNGYVFHCGVRPVKNDRTQIESSQNADSHRAVAQTRPAL